MIIIKKVRGKNFLAIGSDFLELDLRKYNRSIIYGNSGASKSTIGSLITFSLFGQMIKDINKAQIINSVNGKNTLVEIEFTADSNEYLVRRGIKPNIFEIIMNGESLEQTNANDFQTYLEKNILKTTFKTFLQTSILSVENYKPFMTLKPYERRSFIEDILDIKVFTFMNQIVKNKVSKNKEEIKLIDLKLKSAFEKAKLQKFHIDKLESIKTTNTEVINQKIEILKKELSELTNETSILSKLSVADNVELQTHIRKSKEHQQILFKLDKLEKTIVDAVYKIDTVNGETCPVCSSAIHESTKCNIINPLKLLINESNNTKSILVESLKQYETTSDIINSINTSISKRNTEISVNNSSISKISKEINNLQTEIVENTSDEELADLKAELKQTAITAMNLKQKLSDINIDQDYNLTMIELFKDSGVKAKIVEQYITIINNLVNSYLEKMDFYISFHLDSEFNEIIKSVNRDNFTYGSFSAGERQKIDISLLLSFRQLARIRNAFDTNLLFLDEILEFLDQAGIDAFLNILETEKEFSNSNIFIISHKLKEQLIERFDGNYEVYKELGFGKLKDYSL